jgi:hypothetical protein
MNTKQSVKWQAMILMAIGFVVFWELVALAIDGGMAFPSAAAQNASDASPGGGARQPQPGNSGVLCQLELCRQPHCRCRGSRIAAAIDR